MKLNPFSKKSNPYLDKIKSEHDALTLELTPLKAELAEAEAEHAAAREKQTRLRDAAGSLSMNTPPAAKAHWPILCEANQRMERLKSKVSNLESQLRPLQQVLATPERFALARKQLDDLIAQRKALTDEAQTVDGQLGKIAKRLAERHSRRKKKRVRGQLDFRKTLRKNAAYDGVMFETFWRSKVVDRPRVVAICDVSGSVRQYARFLLLFLHSLGEQVSDLRSFAFTNHLVEVSDTFESLPVEQAVDKVMQAVGGSGTDYGQTLLDIEAQLLDDIDRRTTVLILGDARNNRGQAQVQVMQQLYQRARRVIWLNPEPVSFWGLGDSEMKRYAPYCHIARECNSIAHLESTLDALLRTHSASA
jgi:uncharacterized protein with von Willebrand factor type A (vWA) domain